MSKETKKANKSEETIKDRRSSSLKLVSIFSVIILLVIVLASNLLFDKVLGDKLTFDFTSTEQNSISDITKDYLNNLPADTSVRIVGLMAKPVNIKDNYFEYIVPLLDDYQAESGGRITVEYIDPSVYPSIITELDPDGVYDLASNSNCYVLKYQDKIRVVNPIDCYTYDADMLTYGYYTPTANIAEATFTNALINLTSGYSKKAYFVTGLQNNDDHVQLTNILASMNIDSANIAASDSFEIPDDCDLLFVAGINADINERMAIEMNDYLNAGGKMIVAVDYTQSNSSVVFSNLNSVLATMNMQFADYQVIDFDDDYRNPSDYSESSVMITASFTDLANTNSFIRAKAVRPLSEAGTPYSYIQVSPVLQTSTLAAVPTMDGNNLIPATTPQTYNVAMYSTFTGMSTPPEMYAFGTLNFTSDAFIQSNGYQNDNIVMMRNIVRNLVGVSDTYVVGSKPLSDYSYDASLVKNSTVSMMTFVLMIIVPLALIICGVIVYNKRKNL